MVLKTSNEANPSKCRVGSRSYSGMAFNAKTPLVRRSNGSEPGRMHSTSAPDVIYRLSALQCATNPPIHRDEHPTYDQLKCVA